MTTFLPWNSSAALRGLSVLVGGPRTMSAMPLLWFPASAKSFLSWSTSGRSQSLTRKMGAIMDSAAPRASQFLLFLSRAISIALARCVETASSSGRSPRPGSGRPCACRRMASTSLRAWWEALRARVGAWRHWKSGRRAARRADIMVGAFVGRLRCGGVCGRVWRSGSLADDVDTASSVNASRLSPTRGIHQHPTPAHDAAPDKSQDGGVYRLTRYIFRR